MGGGGSDSTTQSTTNATFPPEFRPLAEGAVEQILALQQALPLSQFAGTEPQGVAGIAPFQQAALNFIPGLLQPSAGLNPLNELTTPLSQAAGQAFGVGQRAPGTQGALDALVASGRVPAGTAAPPTPAFSLQQFLSQLPQSQQLASVIPGVDPQALAQLLGRPIPQTTPVIRPPSLLPPIAGTPPTGTFPQ